MTSSAARGQLVDHADLGRRQLPAGGVGGPAQVDDGGHPGAADGHVGDPLTPGPPEGVRDDDPDLDAEAPLQAGPDPTGRAVGVEGEQGGRPLGHVRQVDTGVGAHEALGGLGDEQVAPPPQDPGGLPFDQRHLGRRIVGVDRDHPTLGLRDDLLGHHHNVALLERRGTPEGRRQGVPQHRGQVVARADLGHAGQRQDLEGRGGVHRRAGGPGLTRGHRAPRWPGPGPARATTSRSGRRRSGRPRPRPAGPSTGRPCR